MPYGHTSVAASGVIRLMPATPTVTADLAAFNAAANIKAAKALDQLFFALSTLERSGILTSSEVPSGSTISLGDAYDTLVAGVSSLTSVTVSIDGIDAAGVKAFKSLVAEAQKNEKSALVQHAASIISVVK